MLEFRVIEDKDNNVRIVQIEPVYQRICKFEKDPFVSQVSGDIVDFLNDKYADKEMNAEWRGVNRWIRIKYHIKQLIKLLFKRYSGYTEHGDGVE